MSTISYEELIRVTTHYLSNRKGWDIIGWNIAPGEKSVVRYVDIDECQHAACVIHLYAEMREDETFGVFKNIIEDVAELAQRTNAELIIIFRRPQSKIVFVYIMDAGMMNKTFETWTEGKQKQFQIPIKFFRRVDEFEFDLSN